MLCYVAGTVGRLSAAGMVTEKNWRNLWAIDEEEARVTQNKKSASMSPIFRGLGCPYSVDLRVSVPFTRYMLTFRVPIPRASASDLNNLDKSQLRETILAPRAWHELPPNRARRGSPLEARRADCEGLRVSQSLNKYAPSAAFRQSIHPLSQSQCLT